MSGNEPWKALMTFLLINFLSLMSLGTVMIDLADSISLAFPIIEIVLLLSINTCLWCSALKDPACIPSREFLLRLKDAQIDKMSNRIYKSWV